MRLSELQSKKIISINNGSNIGNIVDMVINNDGKIEKVLLDQGKSFFPLNRDSDRILEWSDIVKVGEDVILTKTE